MRVNRIGWFIVTFFLIGGIAFWIVIPEIFIGQIWVAVSVFLILFYVRMNRRANQAEDIKRTGVRGEAQLLEMTQTGVYVNNLPRVKLKLRIQAPGIAPFEDTRTMTVPHIALGRLSDGMPLTVYLKPEDPSGYVIDWFGQPPAAPRTAFEDEGEPEERLAKLQKLRSSNLITPEEYEAHRKRILEDV